jgi:hypothetical protein
MRRAGFLATLAAGFALVAASLHGIAGVDQTLKVAVAPQPTVQPELVRDDRVCEREYHRGHRERPPEV